MCGMILYVDTASSGKWEYRRGKGAPPIPDDRQPHLVRLSWLLEDESGRARCHSSRLVEMPDGFQMEQIAAAKTGIFDQILIERGGSVRYAMGKFLLALDEADKIVAFNWQHARMVLETSLRRCGQAVPRWPESDCAMVKAARITQIPHLHSGGWKWPTFEQAYESLHGGRKWQASTQLEADGLARIDVIRQIYHAVMALSGSAYSAPAT